MTLTVQRTGYRLKDTTLQPEDTPEGVQATGLAGIQFQATVQLVFGLLAYTHLLTKACCCRKMMDSPFKGFPDSAGQYNGLLRYPKLTKM